MASFSHCRWLVSAVLFAAILARVYCIDIYDEWVVSLDSSIKPALSPQPVITINGLFPGPLINTTTNDVVHINVFNNISEPLLFTWNGIQQRLNSWQDGVSGTNCPIQPGTNWTYVFQVKDQIGTFTYFPSINFQKAAGGFGPIRVNNRVVIAVPFPAPEAEFDLLIGDWFDSDYRVVRSSFQGNLALFPDLMLINGKGPFEDPTSEDFESFPVTKGKTYRFRISNVGTFFSFNFRIQNHQMVLVETEGSYTNQITLDSLDVHVGQSYSVLVTADQDENDYFMVATPKLIDTSNSTSLVAKGLLHYTNSISQLNSSLPSGPDPFDIEFSVDQAKSIRWNLTAGAARPNPQGTFNVTNVTLSQTCILHGFTASINGLPRYVVNNVSYSTPTTPLKLADQFLNGTGVYQLDEFPTNTINESAAFGVSVVSGQQKTWLEIVFKNDLNLMDSWHLDGSAFYIVGFGDGEWTPESRSTYNLFDPVLKIMPKFSDGKCKFSLLFLVVICLATIINGEDIFLEWHVALNTTVKPISINQPVITINGMFPGPLINSTSNDIVHVNVFNELDEPLLLTWNGIQQRLNSWQDGVSGTNCPIRPGQNWTYVFEMKDQIGSFYYFPSINFQHAAGGFGPIRINNRIVISVPFPKPDDEFDLLIGDWFNQSYKEVRTQIGSSRRNLLPGWMLMNGKVPYGNSLSLTHEFFNVSRENTYRFRISNVGTTYSFNFRIQNHTMLLVETEGSYTNQTNLDSLDVHLGQSYSVLVTMDQSDGDYFMVASPKTVHETNRDSPLVGIGVLHYGNSTTPPTRPLPAGPDPFDIDFSLLQARSIRWNLTAGAARPNPQGTFNVSGVTPNRSFVLVGGNIINHNVSRYFVNNVSYVTPSIPLKLADYTMNGTGVYVLDQYPVDHILPKAVTGTYVVSGIHKEYLEIVLVNTYNSMDSWHLDGFGCFVVGFGNGTWTPDMRSTYNQHDPVVRSTVQVYPKGWTAVYVYMDNPGMWNLRSQNLKHWYLGQELYIRVYDPDLNPNKESLPPENLLYCGGLKPPPTPPLTPAPAPAPSFEPPQPNPSPPIPPSPTAPPTSSATSLQLGRLLMAMALFIFIGM
ncbi:OLC1v1026156C1 [Oldenlandia corymbosa var. corymbosa]|uniref:OLC1v1026156C1 n=1 Tax=Oldenlandia corymbosa var. corymbosa TaxID=529605 RepID=A0AAV1C6D0_OLDCO|nr:OLC1v1026156C1 [Oldenlandia corymbosa var. corymbosa]